MPIELSEIPRAELAALVRAVRVAPRRQFDAPRQRALIALFLFSVGISIFLHAASTRAWSLSPISSDWHTEIQMRGLQNVVVVSSLALAGATHAQNAVQWRVEDGGNGHWYGIIGGGGTIGWHESRGQAQSVGADLTSVDSDAEWGFIRQIGSSPTAWNRGHGPWLGGYQDESAADFSEPAGGWRWVTGGSLVFTAWMDGQPSNDCDSNPENYLHMYGSPSNVVWNDIGEASTCSSFPVRAAVIEWSADCNNDGIVDYGQILAGTLADANQNNIPDCCEAGSPCPGSAVQWRVEDGGNGHWYQGVGTANGIGWASAQVACVSAGGSLVSIGTAAESSWLYETIACRVNLWSVVGPYIVGPWIGARGASGNWRWDDGTPWNYSAWFPGEGPPNGDPGEQFAHFYNGGGPVVVPNNSWADYFDLPFIHSYLIEWSADCNNDSIIDYGQILAGTLADANQNNIPDCCEPGASCDPCPGDVDESGAVNAVDLAAILNTWGSDGGKYSGADIDGNGTVDASDLTAVLSSWGACP